MRGAILEAVSKLPPFVGAVPDDVERFRAMSPTERLELFIELCDLTDSVVNARPDADQLRRPERRSDEAEALWKGLMSGSGRG